MRKKVTKLRAPRRRKNPVYITDQNALDLLTQIEGDWWRKEQEFKKTENDDRNFTGFYSNLKMYLDFLKRLNREKNKEDREWMIDMYNQTIYGSGGYHRYFVRGDGKIYFSRGYTGNNETIKLAQDLGFDISR